MRWVRKLLVTLRDPCLLCQAIHVWGSGFGAFILVLKSSSLGVYKCFGFNMFSAHGWVFVTRGRLGGIN